MKMFFESTMEYFEIEKIDSFYYYDNTLTFQNGEKEIKIKCNEIEARLFCNYFIDLIGDVEVFSSEGKEDLKGALSMKRG